MIMTITAPSFKTRNWVNSIPDPLWVPASFGHFWKFQLWIVTGTNIFIQVQTLKHKLVSFWASCLITVWVNLSCFEVPCVFPVWGAALGCGRASAPWVTFPWLCLVEAVGGDVELEDSEVVTGQVTGGWKLFLRLPPWWVMSIPLGALLTPCYAFSPLFWLLVGLGRGAFPRYPARPDQMQHGPGSGAAGVSRAPGSRSHRPFSLSRPFSNLQPVSSFHLAIWASESRPHFCWLLLFLSRHLRTAATVLKASHFQALGNAGALHENWVPALLRCFCTLHWVPICIFRFVSLWYSPLQLKLRWMVFYRKRCLLFCCDAAFMWCLWHLVKLAVTILMFRFRYHFKYILFPTRPSLKILVQLHLQTPLWLKHLGFFSATLLGCH